MSNRNDSDWELEKREAEINMAYYDKQPAEYRQSQWGDDYYAVENLRRKKHYLNRGPAQAKTQSH